VKTEEIRSSSGPVAEEMGENGTIPLTAPEGRSAVMSLADWDGDGSFS